MFNINYGIVVLRAGDPLTLENVLHFVGYEEPPCPVDFEILNDELNTEEDLGFVGKMEGLELVEAPPEIVEYFCEEIGPIEDD